MKPQRIVGLLLIVAGVILFVVGVSAADSLSDRVSEFFTGHFTDRTMWFLIGGVIMTIGGIALMAIPARRG